MEFLKFILKRESLKLSSSLILEYFSIQIAVGRTFLYKRIRANITEKYVTIPVSIYRVSTIISPLICIYILLIIQYLCSYI